MSISIPSARARREHPRAATLSRVRDLPLPRPELVALLVVAALLDLWGLSRNGYANTYYSAAVRSMSTSWHDFLFASFDKAGVMTVDKPPLAFWIQALSARLFGLNAWALLVPQALMGVASVGLTYDLVRRRFGRAAGFAGGLALATTPIAVAISRHNNPDALLVLCSVAALWFLLRALEDGRTRWLVLSGVMVGLGFETKMAAALLIVPAIAAAYLWIAPTGRWRAVRQLSLGGVALAVVGLAWPVLVWLTPSGSRPWVSGTSDNSIWSLIFGYNGLGRVDGQQGGPGGTGAGGAPGGGAARALGGTASGGGFGGARTGGGGPGGGGNSLFGGDTGPFRLFNQALGGQGAWLLGAAVVAGAAVLVLSRLRRGDPRTGWLIAVGGAFLTTAVVFSTAKGIFHPYYVSALAPWTAALVGAGVGVVLQGGLASRVAGPLLLAAGVAGEAVVLHDNPGELGWVVPLTIVLGALASAALIVPTATRGALVRRVALAVGVGALLIAPATWATQTLGHATNGTFPAGGPASAGGGFGGMGGPGGGGRSGFGRAFGGGQAGGTAGGSASGGGAPPTGGTASGGGFPGGGAPPSAGGTANGGGVPPTAGGGTAGGTASGGGTANGGTAPGGGGFSGGAGAGGGMFGGNADLTQALAYAKAHGGGTVAVASQQGAASAIIQSGADVAALGGFSGRESEVSATWLADAVRAGKVRFVLTDGTGGGRQDGRVGTSKLFAAVQATCTKVTLPSGSSSTTTTSAGTMYDCLGRADALAARG